MARFGLIVWLCMGAFGLGLVLLEATRRRRPIRAGWVALALGLGPIFLFFILPLWVGRWGRNPYPIDKERELENDKRF